LQNKLAAICGSKQSGNRRGITVTAFGSKGRELELNVDDTIGCGMRTGSNREASYRRSNGEQIEAVEEKDRGDAVLADAKALVGTSCVDGSRRRTDAVISGGKGWRLLRKVDAKKKERKEKKE
jgi:hypothetical protein